MSVLSAKNVNIVHASNPKVVKKVSKTEKFLRKKLTPKLTFEKELNAIPQSIPESSGFHTPKDLISEPNSQALQESPKKKSTALSLTQIPKEDSPSQKAVKLTHHALDQLQYMICEREMDVMPCGHPFCAQLKRVKLPLNNFRNILLFELEMITESNRSQLLNLRESCYGSEVYNRLISDWKLSSDHSFDPGPAAVDFPIAQLFIGPSPTTSTPSIIGPAQNGTSDRVKSRRNLMPHSSLAERNQKDIFSECVDPNELLKDSSSGSIDIADQTLEKCSMHRHFKSACVLERSRCVENARKKETDDQAYWNQDTPS